MEEEEKQHIIPYYKEPGNKEPESKGIKSYVSIRVGVLLFFIIAQCLLLYMSIDSGITYNNSITINKYNCIVLNSTFEKTIGRNTKYTVSWFVYYHRYQNNGTEEIREENLDDSQRLYRMQTHKIGLEYPCSLLWEMNNTFYFKWFDRIDNQFFIVVTFISCISFALFIVYVIASTYGFCKKNTIL